MWAPQNFGRRFRMKCLDQPPTFLASFKQKNVLSVTMSDHLLPTEDEHVPSASLSTAKESMTPLVGGVSAVPARCLRDFRARDHVGPGTLFPVRYLQLLQASSPALLFLHHPHPNVQYTKRKLSLTHQTQPPPALTPPTQHLPIASRPAPPFTIDAPPHVTQTLSSHFAQETLPIQNRLLLSSYKTTLYIHWTPRQVGEEHTQP